MSIIKKIGNKVGDALAKAALYGGSLANVKLSDEEIKNRMRINAQNKKTEKWLKVKKGIDKGVMTPERHDLLFRNIKSRRKKRTTDTGWMK